MQHSWLDSGSFSLLIMLLIIGVLTGLGRLLYAWMYWISGESMKEASEPSVEGDESRTIKAAKHRKVA